MSGNDDGSISTWDLTAQTWIDRIQAHDLDIAAMGMLGGLNQVVSCGADGSIKVWELQNYPLVEVHSIDSTKPYQQMKLAGVNGLNQSQLTTLVQLGANLDKTDLRRLQHIH
jgi:WD40 repeat protein